MPPDVYLLARETQHRGVAEKRLRRLVNKTSGLCKLARVRIGADACPVLEGLREGCKLRTEAPVNGGRNYNGPKVAKFLVG